MELTIHIGPHKTGTTAIQTAFAKAAAGLKRRGFLYPRSNWFFPAQHRLAFAMKHRPVGPNDLPDLETELAQLSEALARFPGKQALISSEEFFACPPETIRHLRESIGPARIVTFLRRPDDFLISSYNQKIKQPGNGFSAPIRRFVATPDLIAPEFDFLKCVSAWADVFGDQSILLETYEAAPPLDRLRTILGLGDMPQAPPGRPNASVPGAVVEIMRHAKAMGMDTHKQRQLFNRIIKHFADYPPFSIKPVDRREIIAKAEDRNRTLFARFGKSNPYAIDALEWPPAERPHNLIHQDLVRLVETLL